MPCDPIEQGVGRYIIVGPAPSHENFIVHALDTRQRRGTLTLTLITWNEAYDVTPPDSRLPTSHYVSNTTLNHRHQCHPAKKIPTMAMYPL